MGILVKYLPLSQNHVLSAAEARDTSFNGTIVLSLKPRFLNSVFIHPNKTKYAETAFWKVKARLAGKNVWPNTHYVLFLKKLLSVEL
jgi:hypothetical protein